MPYKDKEHARAYRDAYNKEYVIKNKGRLLEQGRKYRQQPKVKENRRDYNQKHYIENREKIILQVKIYYENNKELLLAHDKELYKKNKDRVIKRGVIYNKVRRETDPNFKILHALRRRLSNAIVRGYKSAKALELLGCSVDFFRKYIESKFEGGMSWGNYGLYGWHIDHIIPCCSFNLIKSEEQRRCFHYTNLQPLWARENDAKGNRLIGVEAG